MTKRIVIDARKQDDFGIGTYIRVLLEGLDRLRPSDLEFETLHRGQKPPSQYASHAFNAADYSLKGFAGLGRAARKAGADLLHVPHFTLPLAAPPTVLTVHDLIHLRFPRFYGSAKISALKFHLRRSFRKARAIIAVSQSTKSDILNFMPEVEGKLTVIPEAASPVYYEKRDVPRGDHFLFIGNDKPHKNIPFLLSAWSRFQAEHPGARLLMLTPGNYSGPGIETRSNIAEQEMPSLIASARALIAPSLWEGFDLPVLEAILMKTPVIASDIPVHRELLGGHPFLFPPDKPDALFELLLRSSQSAGGPGPVQALYEKAVSFKPEDMAGRTVEIYRTVLG
jgi:glycosyltransferase involved in cell wall biosynthesis